MKIILTTALAFFCITLFAQDTVYLSRGGLNRRINKEFMSVAAGQTNTTLGNYASIDFINGSFSLKGVAPIGKDSCRLSFISLRMDGSLLGNSPTALFTNSKVNTGAGIRLEYHLRLKRTPIIFRGSERANLHVKLQQLQKAWELMNEQLSREYDQTNLDTARAQAMRVLKVAQYTRGKLETTKRKFIAEADSSERYGAADTTFRKAVDTISKLEKKIAEVRAAENTAKKNIDSIQQLYTRADEILSFKWNEGYQEFKKQRMELEAKAPFERIAFGWVTGILGYSKKKYYTYHPTLPYAQQVDNEELGAAQAGLVYNRYSHNYDKKRAVYWNIGALRMNDNNASFYSTTEMKQEIKRSSTDTTRTITRMYNVYTDPIINFKQWSLFANWTFLFTQRLSGIHIYPSVDIRDHGNTLTHLGIGYAFSFINEKKDQPIINIETYVQFQDLFNELNIKPKFYNRNEIGVRLTLPFNFYTNKINYYGPQAQ